MLFRFLNLATAAALAGAAGSGLRTEERNLATPSAKFAASWETTPVVAVDCINEDQTDGTIWEGYDTTFCSEAGVTNSATPELVLSQGVSLGKIKIPNDKEILVTLSTEASIFTINTATSKKGGKQEDGTQDFYGNIGATSAMAGIAVTLMADGDRGDSVECAPGPVTMASRYVELRNRIGGNVTYEDCYGDVISPTCDIKIADVELESSIGIALNTTAAHSFQWVCPDMPSDTYEVTAMFSLSAEANDLCDAVNGEDCSTIPVADLAGARVILGSRIMTVQQVRAVKGSLQL